MKAKKRTALLGRVYLIICLIVALFPIYWMINTSFKSDSEIYAKVPTLYHIILQGLPILI